MVGMTIIFGGGAVLALTTVALRAVGCGRRVPRDLVPATAETTSHVCVLNP
jgi:hypothetical protein